jgi:hypothetical protein
MLKIFVVLGKLFIAAWVAHRRPLRNTAGRVQLSLPVTAAIIALVRQKTLVVSYQSHE